MDLEKIKSSAPLGNRIKQEIYLRTMDECFRLLDPLTSEQIIKKCQERANAVEKKVGAPLSTPMVKKSFYNYLEKLDKECVLKSRPRNPIIADACFKAGYIDSWGRGTLKIYKSCLEAELPEPEIKPLDGGVLVTLFKDYLGEEQLRKLGLNERQIKAVTFAKAHVSISNADYQKLNDIGKTTATEELSKLVELGVFTAPIAKGRGAKYTLN